MSLACDQKTNLSLEKAVVSYLILTRIGRVVAIVWSVKSHSS
jgi:hypothetical protein